MTDKEVMQQALDALEKGAWDTLRGRNAAEALRTAIAQLEPEPVAWMYDWTTSDGEFIQDWTTSEAETLRDTKPNIISNIRPLYTAQRKWVGLTDEDISGCINATASLDKGPFLVEFSKSIEAKLKEKNS